MRNEIKTLNNTMYEQSVKRELKEKGNTII